MMTRIGLLTCVALPALLLTACKDNRGAPTVADSPSTNTDVSTSATGEAGPAPAPTPVTDASAQRAPDYLAQAGAGDLFEIESSKAVMARTKNARVREFATMMVKAHEESTARLKAAADASKLPVKPPVLMPEQQSMLEGIKSASPASVDAVYIANQKTAHQAALALHQDYAARGDIPALKDAAGEIVPVVRSHIEHLAQLSSQ